MTPTPEMMAMAKSIVKEFYPEMRSDYEGRRVKIALAAITAVTERAAALADNWNAGRLDRVTEASVAEALRNFDHLKGATPNG